jgi:hypothetical protein
MQALLTVEQLSVFLQKTVASIRSDVSRNPMSLPPICRLPGTKRLLWRVEDVERWLAYHVSDPDGFEAQSVALVEVKRGRPSKTDQIKKQKALSLSQGNRSRMVSNGR